MVLNSSIHRKVHRRTQKCIVGVRKNRIFQTVSFFFLLQYKSFHTLNIQMIYRPPSDYDILLHLFVTLCYTMAEFKMHTQKKVCASPILVLFQINVTYFSFFTYLDRQIYVTRKWEEFHIGLHMYNIQKEKCMLFADLRQKVIWLLCTCTNLRNAILSFLIYSWPVWFFTFLSRLGAVNNSVKAWNDKFRSLFEAYRYISAYSLCKLLRVSLYYYKTLKKIPIQLRLVRNIDKHLNLVLCL